MGWCSKETSRDAVDVGPSFINGLPVLHIEIFPQKEDPASAQVHQIFREHNLTIDDKEMDAILSGREQAIGSIDSILQLSPPVLSPKCRREAATKIADGILMGNLKGQLSREAPTALDRDERRSAARASAGKQQSVKSILQEAKNGVPVKGGVYLTIHFPGIAALFE